MKWFRYMTVAALAGAVGLLSPMAVMAASPEFARTQEEWEKLRDNIIEYEELEDLVHEYNATVQNNEYNYKKFREDYGDTNADVSDAYYDLAQDFYNDMSGEDDAGSMMMDLNLQIQADNMMKQADNTLEDSRIYLLTYEQAEKSLAAAAQSDMISYYKKLLERQQKEAELDNASRTYELARVQLAAGTATQLDVLTAQENAQKAENDLTQLDSDIQSLKESFFILLGWKHNDDPVIGELPETDLARIDHMKPDEDLAQALENNYTLRINKRKLENARDQTTRDSLTESIANNEKKIGASLSSAYKAVLSARLSYEQALADAQLQEENMKITAGKLQAGMITELEYQKQENARSSAQYNVQTASMTLLEAMETYDWSVRGLAAAE
ncbi:MAG: TolC family protein [Enterocloster sp.]